MKIRVLDIETTQTDPNIKFNIQNDQICEIAITQLDTTTGNIIPIYETLCRGPQPPNPDSWIFNNSTITPKDIENAPMFHTIKTKLQQILNTNIPITSYNQNYDFPRLEHPKHGLKLKNTYWDPIKILAPITKIQSKHGYKYPTLEQAHRHLYPNEPYACTHRALDDSITTAKIIYKIIQQKPMLDQHTPNWITATHLLQH